MPFDRGGDDARFAVTFCATGVESSVIDRCRRQRILLGLFRWCSYRCTRRNYCRTRPCRMVDAPIVQRIRVILSSGTNRTSAKWPSFFFPSTLNKGQSVPFPVVKISESSPGLMGMGFERV